VPGAAGPWFVVLSCGLDWAGETGPAAGETVKVFAGPLVGFEP
jgi:hypothetical protein